ncbi:MalY/PatB family protein [Nocardioides solisilvae]|uniref:MalY/PatB family protein n=1 Tax=Nocardioides solisilvae TaxID=1542435 RepID=UPI000D74F5C3|nr:aminotransferase class I/II-fold pyridoxal phosphate-dependent enzyme [Nocardioides solisilvae]
MEILGAGLDELRGSRTSIKWQVHGPDVLPLWVAEMDSAPCAPVVEAVTDAMRRGDTGYAWSPPLVEAFVGFAARRWGWEVEPGRVMQVPDVMIGIEELVQARVPAGGAVVVSPPVYDSFFGFVASTRRRLVEAPLGPDHRLDLDTLRGAFEEAGMGSAYLLCNPQNPTGTVHTPEELTAVAELADEHGVLVVSDEIHAPLVHAGATFTPYLSLPAAGRGLALVSGSKAWNLAGLKTALLVAGHGTGHGLHEVVTHGAQHLAVIAQTAAWEHGEPWLDQLLGELADRRALLADLLAEHLPGVTTAPAEATYLAWMDCSSLGLEDPAAIFLERGVALVPGPRYDRRAEQHVRLNLATSPEVLTEAVRRMAG